MYSYVAIVFTNSLDVVYRSVARLLVEAKPEFKLTDKFLEPIIIRAGNSATLEVPFHGSPQPRPQWKVRERPQAETLTPPQALHSCHSIFLSTMYVMY